jgi:hypothetical protein
VEAAADEEAMGTLAAALFTPQWSQNSSEAFPQILYTYFFKGLAPSFNFLHKKIQKKKMLFPQMLKMHFFSESLLLPSFIIYFLHNNKVFREMHLSSNTT